MCGQGSLAKRERRFDRHIRGVFRSFVLDIRAGLRCSYTSRYVIDNKTRILTILLAPDPHAQVAPIASRLLIAENSLTE